MIKRLAILGASLSLVKATSTTELNNKINNESKINTRHLCRSNKDCLNNAVCNKNTRECNCIEGFTGKDCNLRQPIVKCLPDRIEIHVQKQWAKINAHVDSFDQLYLGNNSNDEQCQSFPHPEDSNTYILQINENSTCGTKVNRDNITSNYIYSNEVLSSSLQKAKQDIDINISRMPIISILKWQCIYKSQYQISYQDKDTNIITPIKVTNTVTLPNNNGNIKIQSFSDNNYNNHQTETLYDGDNLFIELSNNKNKNFDIEQCQALLVKDNIKTDIKLSNIFSNKQCNNQNYLNELYPNTEILSNTKKDLKIKFNINKNDIKTQLQSSDQSLSDEEIDDIIKDPKFYIKCSVTDNKIQNDKCDNSHVRKRREIAVNDETVNLQNSSNESNESSSSNNSSNNNDQNKESSIQESKKSDALDNASNINTLETANNLNNAAISEQNKISDDVNNNSKNDNNLNESNKKYIIENGPFIIKNKIINNNEIIENNDINTEAITELINALEKAKDSVNKADAVQLESVLQHLQRATDVIKPLIELKSEYSLNEFDMPGPMVLQGEIEGDFITINDINDDQEELNVKRRVRTMIILAISIGIIFICLIALPILFVFYRNHISNINKNKDIDHENQNYNNNGNDEEANDTSNKQKIDQHQIITMDTGLNVDHALHFVEYTDHIHDLVFEDEYNEGQYPANMWVKQISTDTQSIDISNQDPIKMTYTNSLYNKNPHNPNTTSITAQGGIITSQPSHNSNIICSQDTKNMISKQQFGNQIINSSKNIRRTSSNSSNNSSINSFQGTTTPSKQHQHNLGTKIGSQVSDLPIPSYVTMNNNNSSKDIKRKKSFRLAGVKIPTEIINNIMTNEHTTKPYNNHNQIEINQTN